MNYFPAPDPIPLPAPVWLFKVLHNLTLTLHLGAMQIMAGGLIIGLLLALRGRLQSNRDCTQAAGMLAHRLPTVMAFVINLGVPPLLFAQVLYGRALYTSSVLIGTYWISVIFLLMASYYGLYYSAKRAEAGKPWFATGLAALLLVGTIGFIYTNNMTLMLRPQVWAAMYRHSPGGVQLNVGDPTAHTRWGLFVLGGLASAGCAMMLLSLRKHFDKPIRRLLFKTGAGATVIGVALQVGFALPTLQAQPAGVISAILADPVYSVSAYAWVALGALLLLAALLALVSGEPATLPATASAVLGFVHLAATVMVRDGIRDVTLRLAGFEVWDRQVVTNWSVVGLFLVLFIAALGVIGYLIRVVASARRIEEKYA